MCSIMLKTWTLTPLMIEDPIGLADAFMGDVSFLWYDLAPVEQDNSLGTLEVWAGNLLNSTLKSEEAIALLSKLPAINAALAEVPNNISLFEDISDNLWDALKRLFECFLTIPSVGPARTTKILHKKRPRLIPPMDNKATLPVYGEGLDPDNADGLVEVLKRIRWDIIHNSNLSCLHATRAAIPKLDGITIVKIFDMILWQAWKTGLLATP